MIHCDKLFRALTLFLQIKSFLCVMLSPSSARRWRECFSESRTIVQAVSCWLLAAETQVHTQVSSCGISGGQSGIATLFLLDLRSPLSISFHRHSIFTPISCRGRSMGPFEAQFHRDIVAPQRNKNNKVSLKLWYLPLSPYGVTTQKASIDRHLYRLGNLKSQ